MSDASSKAYNYFCTREKQFELAAEPVAQALDAFHHSGSNEIGSKELQTNSLSFRTFAHQATVLGYGASHLAYKWRNFFHEACLQCQDEPSLKAWRHSVTGFTSDQGTERKLADSALACEVNKESIAKFCQELVNGLASLDRSENSDASSDYYLLPNCLYMPGHQHILFNSLKSAVLKSKLWGPKYVEGLRALLSFLGDRPLRQRFIATCMGHAPSYEAKAFVSFSKELLDWRWESLGQILSNLTPVMPIILKYWNFDRMKSGHLDSLGTIETATLGVCNRFFSIPWLETSMHVLMAFALGVNRFSSWLEGCQCHQHLWTLKIPYANRMSLYQQSTGLSGCVHKGARGPELASGEAEAWLQRISHSCSAELNKQLHLLDVDRRSGLVAVEQDLIECINEELGAKLAFWQFLPYKLLGLGCRSLHVAKRIARECRLEYEAANKQHLHRVTFRFFGVETIKAQLMDFETSVLPLSRYPELAMLVFCYITISVVERSIESEHAKITEAGLLLNSY
jgi:hypothetical protein